MIINPDRSLTITIKPEVAKKLIEIGQYKDTEPEALVSLYIAKGLTRDWDFQNNKPKGRKND